STSTTGGASAAADVLQDRVEPEEADQPDQDADRGVSSPAVGGTVSSDVRPIRLSRPASCPGESPVAHLVLSAAPPDGVTVARVAAPDRRISGATETGPDERPQRLPEDLLRLSRSALGPVVLDCRLVDMIDSAGVGIVLSLWKGLRVAKHPLALCAPESIRQVFEVARLTRLIPCMTDLADAARLILPAGAEITPEGPAPAETCATDPDPPHP